MKKVKPFNRNRARLEMMHLVFEFSLGLKLSDSNGVWAYHPFNSRNVNPKIGSLVAPQSCRTGHKWYLSWLREIDRDRYLLESIDDGELCWWSNIGIVSLPDEVLEERPKFKWDDDQFKLNDRWSRIGYKKFSHWCVLPNQLKFDENGSVTFSTRIKWEGNESGVSKTFEDWKKVRIKDMENFFMFAIEQYELSLEKKQNEKSK